MWHNHRLLNKICALLWLGSVTYFLLSGARFLMNTDYFDVDVINVRGDVQHLESGSLRSTMVKNFKGGFLNLNLNAAKAALEEIPRIESVEITRDWPRSLTVYVTERKEIARWKRGGLLDSRGVLFEVPSSRVLPMLSGPPNSHETVVREYLNLDRLLYDSGRSLEYLGLSDELSWSARLRGGPTIALGKENLELRLRRFMRFLPEVEKSMGKKVDYIDLRYTNGFSVSSTVY